MATSNESRRGFLKGFLATASAGLVAMVAYPVLRFISPPSVPEAATSQVLAGTVQELDGRGWKIFAFGSAPGILVRLDSGEYKAFSALCTHLDCTVQYRPEERRFWCPCHNGFFDLNGINVAGPPPKPLTAYVVNVQDNDIFVSRS